MYSTGGHRAGLDRICIYICVFVSISVCVCILQVAIVLGGIGLGRLVDETKEFKKVIIACLGCSLVRH